MEMENITDKGEDIEYGISNLPEISEPIKKIEKYWGNMLTIFEGENYTVKRIFMRSGTQSSLEFHVKKKESYYIESGTLKIGLRIGRARNTSVTLHQGDIFHIDPGLMHMRIAKTDVVIIETSTKDDDGDSHIVEDGRSYKHEENIMIPGPAGTFQTEKER